MCLFITPLHHTPLIKQRNNFSITIGMGMSSICAMGRDSSVGIATRYGLDGLGSNPGGGEIFRTRG
jgi:hypothetical protein